MTRKAFMTAVAVITLSTPAIADTVLPADVVFDDYGVVEQSLTGMPGDPEKGMLAMNKGAGNCIACHHVTALLEVFPYHGEVGPSLDGVGDRWAIEELRGIVADAKKTFPESVMPSFYKTEGFFRPGKGFTGKAAEGPIQPYLSAEQIEDVVAYLLTLTE